MSETQDARRAGASGVHGEWAAQMPLERVRSMTSAYVYGNVLVLAAVVGAGAHSVADGSAVLTVLVTTLSTYLAHVLAHDVAQRIGRSDAERRHHVRAELRDAVPILASGVPPALALGLAGLGWISVGFAGAVAAAIVVGRLAATGWNVARLSGDAAAPATLWSGIGLALAGALIATVKVAAGQ